MGSVKHGSRGQFALDFPPSTDYDFEGYYEWMVNGDAKVFDSKHTYIPAEGSIDVPFEASGRTINTNYPLQVCYLRNSDWTDWNVLATLTCKPAIVTIDASGSKTVIQPANSYTVPDNVVSVEMTGAGVTSVTKNSNPNTLYMGHLHNHVGLTENFDQSENEEFLVNDSP